MFQKTEVLKRIQLQVPNVLLLLAPRHPKRFDAVARMLQAHGHARESFHSELRRHTNAASKSAKAIMDAECAVRLPIEPGALNHK